MGELTQTGDLRSEPVKMPPITEAQFLKQVVALAQTFGFKVAHFQTAHIQRKDGSHYYATPIQADGEGFPDLVLAKRGHPIYFLELKGAKGRTTQAQADWLYLLDRGSSPAMVIKPSDWDSLVKLLGGKNG